MAFEYTLSSADKEPLINGSDKEPLINLSLSLSL